MVVQSRWAGQQPRVIGMDAGAFQPHAWHFKMLVKPAHWLTGLVFSQRLACRRKAQCRDIPADPFGARSKRHRQPVFGLATSLNNNFQRQPFEPCFGSESQIRALQGGLAI